MLGKIGGVEGIEAGDRLIVRHLAMAAEHPLDDLVAIDGIFEREADILIVEGCVSQRIGKV